MSYERLSPRQKQIVDLLMSGECSPRKTVATMAKRLNLTDNMVKHHISRTAEKYGIRSDLYIPRVRLVYLRAKELGML